MAERDPIKVWVRESRAQRRVGIGAACPCGEVRPFALLPTGVCFACDRITRGREPFENHHVFGKRNGPCMVRMPVNDHRAVLSVAQLSWPPKTQENVGGSPLLRAAAHVRGFSDMIRHLLDECEWISNCLEQLDEWLSNTLGPSWWHGSPIEQYATRQNKEEKKQ